MAPPSRIVFPDDGQSQFDDIVRRLRALETAPSLASSSIKEGATTILDSAGTKRVLLGKDASDGSYGVKIYDAHGNPLVTNDLITINDAVRNRVQLGNLASYTDPFGIVSPAGYGGRVLDSAGGIAWDSSGTYIAKQRFVFLGTNTAATAMSMGGANVVIPFTPTFDPNGNWSVNTYTVPRTGKYWIAGGLTLAPGSSSTSLFLFWINKGVGSGTPLFVTSIQVNTTLTVTATQTGLIALTAGDTVHCEGEVTGSGAAGALLNAAGANWLSIAYLTD
jgi:hypothetical protein